MIARRTRAVVGAGLTGQRAVRVRRERSLRGGVGVLLLVVASCSHQEKKAPMFVASLPPGTSVAIAPPINASGGPDIDMLKVADLMASELSSIPGIGVIGVNRVLAVLAEQGQRQVVSAEHALAICERLGADAIIVFAVTEYDPYTPVVGIVAELYGPSPGGTPAGPAIDSGLKRPFPAAPDQRSPRPWAQVQRTFNAEHHAVQRDVEEYAEVRDANKTPYGWRKYLASQEYYLRYCCYSVARELVQ
ncbi:MAG: hypothetical protein HY718_07345 [Planctomycetes bacterium]|nr:hypothetical protein [Planctomycetota bacterium]